LHEHVVAAELWYAVKRNSDRLTAQVDAVLGAVDGSSVVLRKLRSIRAKDGPTTLHWSMTAQKTNNGLEADIDAKSRGELAS